MIDKIYTDLPLWGKYLVWGIALAQFFALCVKSLSEILPKSRSKKSLDQNVDEYLKQPSYDYGPLERHLVETKAMQIFRRLTGIKCKKEMREALITLHGTSKNSWSWPFISSAYSHLDLYGGELRFRVCWMERIFQAFFYASATFFACLAIIFHMSTVVLGFHDAKQVMAMEGVVVLCIGLGFLFLLLSLPLDRARKLRREMKLEYVPSKMSYSAKQWSITIRIIAAIAVALVLYVGYAAWLLYKQSGKITLPIGLYALLCITTFFVIRNIAKKKKKKAEETESKIGPQIPGK